MQKHVQHETQTIKSIFFCFSSFILILFFSSFLPGTACLTRTHKRLVCVRGRSFYYSSLPS